MYENECNVLFDWGECNRCWLQCDGVPNKDMVMKYKIRSVLWWKMWHKPRIDLIKTKAAYPNQLYYFFGKCMTFRVDQRLNFQMLHRCGHNLMVCGCPKCVYYHFFFFLLFGHIIHWIDGGSHQQLINQADDVSCLTFAVSNRHFQFYRFQFKFLM